MGYDGPSLNFRVVECDEFSATQALHAALDNGVSTITLCEKPIDHGTMIPLSLWAIAPDRTWCPRCQAELRKNGKKLPPVQQARRRPLRL